MYVYGQSFKIMALSFKTELVPFLVNTRFKVAYYINCYKYITLFVVASLRATYFVSTGFMRCVLTCSWRNLFLKRGLIPMSVSVC